MDSFIRFLVDNIKLIAISFAILIIGFFIKKTYDDFVQAQKQFQEYIKPIQNK